MTTAPPYRSAALGGSEIGRCFTRLHHDRFTPAVRVADDVRDRALAGGIAFEAEVLGALDGVVDEVVAVPAGAHPSVTSAAMHDRAPLITGARLSSPDGSLVGYPDLLVLLESGYAPVDVKHHKVIGDRGPTGTVAALDDLAAIDGDEVRFRGFRRRDLLQVAHYRHLLHLAGHASTVPVGGIIGTDDPVACVWVDLTAGETPIMDDYHAYVAEARRAIDHGITEPGAPLHAPWLRGECRRCDWQPLCATQLEAVDDPTLLRDVDAALRAELASGGVRTVADVARLDPADERMPSGATVLQARARTESALLRADAGPDALPLPHPAVEIDLDIETYGGSTYLAGLLVTKDGATAYEPFVDWRGGEEGERALIGRLFERFAAWNDTPALVYHWTDYERRVLTDAGRRYGIGIPGHESVASWFDDHTLDLCDWARTHLVSPNGFSLKTIAPLCGFTWRDDDPGGLQSEIWFERLHAGEASMADRILAYNEDDVRAQLAVRSWVRRQDSGAGPGSGIRSALRPPA